VEGLEGRCGWLVALLLGWLVLVGGE
jgi:hypothetical protein